MTVMSELPVSVDCSGIDRVRIMAERPVMDVSAYDAFSIAGRIQAAAVEAMRGLDAPATYNAQELERIEELTRIIPRGP
jgi:hypothetical protein